MNEGFDVTLNLSFSVEIHSLLFRAFGFGYFKMKNFIEIVVAYIYNGIIELDSLQRWIKSATIIKSCVVHKTKFLAVMIGGVGCYWVLNFQVFFCFPFLVDYVHSRIFRDTPEHM